MFRCSNLHGRQAIRNFETLTNPNQMIASAPDSDQSTAPAPDRPQGEPASQDGDVPRDDQDDRCAICLSQLDDQTIVAPCLHSQYCFRCILVWSHQSRQCPLCLGPIDHLLHHLTSQAGSERYFPLPLLSPQVRASSSRTSQGPPSFPRRLPAARVQEIREEERARFALARRRYAYRHRLYAKHIAANSFTLFRPISPRTFNRDTEGFQARATSFLRRELCVFDDLVGRIEDRIKYIIQILLSLDCKGDPAIRLFSEFVGGIDLAEHFAHELSSFLRSPFQDIRSWDAIVQYDRPLRPDQTEVASSFGISLHHRGYESRQKTASAFFLETSSMAQDRAAKPEPPQGTSAPVRRLTNPSRKRLRQSSLVGLDRQQLPGRALLSPAQRSKEAEAKRNRSDSADPPLGKPHYQNTSSPPCVPLGDPSQAPTDSGRTCNLNPLPSNSSSLPPGNAGPCKKQHERPTRQPTNLSILLPLGPPGRGTLDGFEHLLKLKAKLSLRRKGARLVSD